MRFREHRFPCEVPARLDHADRRLQVSIVNISPHGMRVSGADGLTPGTGVVVRVLTHSLPAEVRWTRAGLAGLRLAQEIAPRVLATIRQTRGTPARGQDTSGGRRSFGAGLMELR